MTISQLIDALEILREEAGDMELRIMDDDARDIYEVSDTTYDSDRATLVIYRVEEE